LRVLVHPAADAVADVLAHDPVAVGLGVALDGPAYVAQVTALAALLDGALQALLGDADELEEFGVNLAHRHGRRRVADEAVQGRADVNREDVALPERVVGREAVDDLLVDGGADGVGEAVVALEGRQGPGVADHALGRAVHVERRHAGLNHPAQLLEHAPDQLARGAHLIQLFSGLPDNHKSS
jgi:hypothetical protein